MAKMLSVNAPPRPATAAHHVRQDEHLAKPDRVELAALEARGEEGARRGLERLAFGRSLAQAPESVNQSRCDCEFGQTC